MPNSPPDCWMEMFESPFKQKKRYPKGYLFFWCERWDSNPHGVTTRTSNVLVYHSNTLANVLEYYNALGRICQYLFQKTLAIWGHVW